MSKPKKSKALCRGCREDYYNGQGAPECWSYKSAKVVKRHRIGWWVTPDTSGAFTTCWTFQCHSAPGQYGHYEKLPSFAVDVHDETR
jgi:hypothetical protein